MGRGIPTETRVVYTKRAILYFFAMARLFLPYPLLLMSVLILITIFSSHVLAETALQTVVSECKKRTGFGDATCKTLVKKNMRVESCKRYTNYSDEECAKKVEEIKKDPEFTPDVVSAPATNPATSVGLPRISSGGQNIMVLIREKKVRDLSALEKRTQTMIDFLNQKGVDTAPIETNFLEFKKRSAILLSAYDTYQAAYEGTATDTSAIKRSIRIEARDKVVRAGRDLVDFYQANILTPLRVAYETSL